MLTIYTETVPGYPETKVKTEVVVNEDHCVATRVLDAKIFLIKIESLDLNVVKKVISISNSDFKLFGSIENEEFI